MAEKSAAPVHFRLVTLGVPRLEIEDCEAGSTHTVGPGKSLALITYLAFSPRRTAPRDTLCDLLWGDRSIEQSRPLLRQTLWLIKTQVWPDIVSATGDTVSLVPPVSCDAEDFSNAIQADDLKGAVARYDGDFFSGYAAPGAGRFEEWANLERTRLRGLFMHAAESLGRKSLDSGRFSETIALANRMRRADPNSQAGWRLLLEARVASGDTIAARADADQFEEWLRSEEWEAEPGSIAAINAARRTSPMHDSSDGPRDLVAELIGREQEFSQIIDAWAAAQSRGARIVQIIGESGVGKTRLTRDILARIRASRGKSRYVRANHGERGIAFSFAAAVAAHLSQSKGAGGVAPAAAKTLVSLNPVLSSRFSDLSGPAEPLTPLRVGLALLELVTAVAEENPIALVLDDMHWCDAASREALTIVGSRLTTEKVLLITASRPVHGVPSVSAQAADIALRPLDENGVAALVTSLGRIPETAWAQRFPRELYVASGGVPLRVLEALRFAIDAKLLILSGEDWMAPDPEPLLAALGKSASMERRVASLSPDENALLLLIGVAGTPVLRSVVTTASGLSETHADYTLSSLERRGIIIEEDGLLLPAHDLIRDATLAHAGDDEIRKAKEKLGRAFALSSDFEQRKKSIAFLAAAGEWREAANHAIPYLKGFTSGRPELDSRLHSLLGAASGDSSLEMIRNELPLTLRRPTLFRNVVLSVVPVGFLAGAYAMSGFAHKTQLPATEIAMINARADGSLSLRTAPLRIDQWNPESRLSFRGHGAAFPPDIASHAAPRPGTESWARYSIYPDSGAGDIELVDLRGHRTRLTQSPGDDRPTSFSPDGSKLLFLTTRWTTRGWSDVAMLDMSTRRVTRITHGDARYAGAAWSPDGTRIAFGREAERRSDYSICIAHADVESVSCRRIDGWIKPILLGWIDDRRILISADSARRLSAVRIYDVDAQSTTSSGFPDKAEVHVDPTGSWTLAVPMSDVRTIRISPSTRYDLAHVLNEDSAVTIQGVFLTPRLPETMLTRVEIEKRASPLNPGTPSQLQAVGYNRDGRHVIPRAPRWRVLTPDIARVDSLGVIVPTRAGTVVVEFSAGGWVSVIDSIPVQPSRVASVLAERWDGSIARRWQLFGEPKPVTVKRGEVSAFLNNGDGFYFSGAYYRQSIDAERGLAVDFTVSTPLTATQWQVIQVFLDRYPTDGRLQKWDNRTGYISPFLSQEGGCSFQYPGGEGEEGATSNSWFDSFRTAMHDTSVRLDTGKWYQVRLQLFPGGRCGLAINGKAVAIASARMKSLAQSLLVVQGSSVGSEILLGPLTVRSGIPGDIDWSKLEFDGYAWFNKQ